MREHRKDLRKADITAKQNRMLNPVRFSFFKGVEITPIGLIVFRVMANLKIFYYQQPEKEVISLFHELIRLRKSGRSL